MLGYMKTACVEDLLTRQSPDFLEARLEHILGEMRKDSKCRRLLDAYEHSSHGLATLERNLIRGMKEGSCLSAFSVVPITPDDDTFVKIYKFWQQSRMLYTVLRRESVMKVGYRFPLNKKLLYAGEVKRISKSDDDYYIVIWPRSGTASLLCEHFLTGENVEVPMEDVLSINVGGYMVYSGDKWDEEQIKMLTHIYKDILDDD